jgi:hypothetical protein
MSSKRIACLVLGGWLALSAVVPIAAMYFIHFGERALARVEAASPGPPGKSDLRTLRPALAAAAGDHVRVAVSVWTQLQVLLGILLFGILFFGEGSSKIMLAFPAAMLLVVVVSHFGIQPGVSFSAGLHDLGIGQDAETERARINGLRNFYLMVEGVKVAIGLGLALMLVTHTKARRRRRSSAGNEVEAVNDAHHSHVNG